MVRGLRLSSKKAKAKKEEESSSSVSATKEKDENSKVDSSSSPSAQFVLAKDLNSSGSFGGGGSRDGGGGVTYANQSKLSRLPIPELKDTLDKFPRFVRALQNEEQFAETLRICQEFLLGDGPTLQQALIDYDRKGCDNGAFGSYVEEFWNESYLSPKGSVVLNLNPFFVLEGGPDPKTSNDQLKRAATLCFASLKLASSLQHETMRPDQFRGRPLCMDQFKMLFGSSRQPAVGKDTVHVYKDSTHVLVLCRNQFYYFQGLWPETGHVAVNESDILHILQAIQRNAGKVDSAQSNAAALGVLTSLPRSTWAVAKQDIANVSAGNKSALHVIDSALFVLVLDDFEPATEHDAAANMLHGTNQLSHSHNDGAATTQIGTCMNRWYDKLQIFVCKDGTTGVNFEHSVVDGHTALRFVSDVFAETVILFAESIVDAVHGRGKVPHVIEATVERAVMAKSQSHSNTLDVGPKKLHFDLTNELKHRIYYAETKLGDEIIASDTCILEFQEYGKQLIVSNKMSPDSFVQMAIMLSYYKLYGEVVCTYEPVLTKAYFHGRTEAMRSAIPEVKELCELWCSSASSASSPDEKIEALRCAIKAHSALVKESAAGKGVDRHLFSLKCMAEKLNMPVPAFFESEAWELLNHTVLSTSNCGNPSLKLFGFGPVVPDGFGIGYIIKDSGLSFSVSSKHRQTQRYVYNLSSVLEEIQHLLEPISSVTVKQQQNPVAQEKTTQELVVKDIDDNDYGDLWGCSEGTLDFYTKPPASPPIPKKTPIVPARRSLGPKQSSSYFTQVQVLDVSQISKSKFM